MRPNQAPQVTRRIRSVELHGTTAVWSTGGIGESRRVGEVIVTSRDEGAHEHATDGRHLRQRPKQAVAQVFVTPSTSPNDDVVRTGDLHGLGDARQRSRGVCHLFAGPPSTRSKTMTSDCSSWSGTRPSACARMSPSHRVWWSRGDSARRVDHRRRVRRHLYELVTVPLPFGRDAGSFGWARGTGCCGNPGPASTGSLASLCRRSRIRPPADPVRHLHKGRAVEVDAGLVGDRVERRR